VNHPLGISSPRNIERIEVSVANKVTNILTDTHVNTMPHAKPGYSAVEIALVVTTKATTT
jgi:hypothetical protein